MTKEELIEGQWYKYHEAGNPIYLFKYRKNGDKIATKGPYLRGTTIEEESDFFMNDDKMENVSPANMEDVYKLFPEEKSQPMNTYGLNVGDSLPSNIINKWANIKGNFCRGINYGWEGTFSGYYPNRKIESFRLINGIVGFKVSGCAADTHYLKAEGFKEFAEGKVELTSLPEKWCIKGIETEPEYKALVKWRTSGGFGPGGYLMCEKYRPGTKGYWEKYKPEGYTEITFEQFKKWVLEQKAPAPKPSPVMDTVGTITGGRSPMFQKGDELVVCSRAEDRNRWGYLNTSRESYTERINDVAGLKFKVTEICTYEGRYYYSLGTGGWICEDCLSYQDVYKIGIDPYIKMHDPQLVQEMVDFSESYKGSVELYSPKKEAIINPAVNTIRSVEVELVKPKKVVLF